MVERAKTTKKKITPGAWEFSVYTYSHSGTQLFPFASYLLIIIAKLAVIARN